MYSTFQITIKYLQYYFSASSGKGHGIHSPFVFDFIKNVLRDKKKYDCYDTIELARKKLLADSRFIEVKDAGAGSSVIKTDKRRIRDIAGSSLKSAKYAQLLFRMANHYRPQTILELGTSFGITSSYLARGNPGAKVYTCEGAGPIAAFARHTFNEMGIKNIELSEGDFADTVTTLLNKLSHIDLAFIDGNHRKAPTLDYFHQLSKHRTPKTILIFDDIHWSAEMEEAWAFIRQDHTVSLSIDLFFIGIVFFNPDFKNKQEFTIRF